MLRDVDSSLRIDDDWLATCNTFYSPAIGPGQTSVLRSDTESLIQSPDKPPTEPEVESDERVKTYDEDRPFLRRADAASHLGQPPKMAIP